MNTFEDLITAGLTPTPEADPAKQSLPTNPPGIPVTFASMIQTDGKTAHVGVYRGYMVGPKGQRFINMNSRLTVHIATEVHARAGRGHIEEVNRLSALYSVAGWPAVDWSL